MFEGSTKILGANVMAGHDVYFNWEDMELGIAEADCDGAMPMEVLSAPTLQPSHMPTPCLPADEYGAGYCYCYSDHGDGFCDDAFNNEHCKWRVFAFPSITFTSKQIHIHLTNLLVFVYLTLDLSYIFCFLSAFL